MVLSDHNEARLIGIVETVSEAVATSLAVWCNWRRIAPIGRQFHDPLGSKVRVEDIATIAKSDSGSAVLMYSRPYVAVLGGDIDGIPIGLISRSGIVATEDITTALLRPTFHPQKVAGGIEVQTADADTTGGDGLRN